MQIDRCLMLNTQNETGIPSGAHPNAEYFQHKLSIGGITEITHIILCLTEDICIGPEELSCPRHPLINGEQPVTK